MSATRTNLLNGVLQKQRRLGTSMLEGIKQNLVHFHAKDISIEQSAVRGDVTGVPVGCACGEGVVDWKRIIDIIKSANLEREIVLSVECGTVEQAIRSFDHLSPLI